MRRAIPIATRPRDASVVILRKLCFLECVPGVKVDDWCQVGACLPRRDGHDGPAVAPKRRWSTPHGQSTRTDGSYRPSSLVPPPQGPIACDSSISRALVAGLHVRAAGHVSVV